jgi:hypothetical protein
MSSSPFSSTTSFRGAWFVSSATGLAPFAIAGLAVFALSELTVTFGPTVGLGAPIALAVFSGMVAMWLAAPNVAAAAMIPLFAALPTLKVVTTPVIGPLKDIVVLSVLVAMAVQVVAGRRLSGSVPVDHLLLALVGLLMLLYTLNLGGGFQPENYGAGWIQGTRLVCEPLILLVGGLTMRHPRRTLEWAVRSLILTGCAVALYGIAQQILGVDRLLGLGYVYGDQVRQIGTLLRSFGTLDESFGYASFLSLALAATVMWMPRSWTRSAALLVISGGLVFSFVRSSVAVVAVLIALALVRHGHTEIGALLLAVMALGAIAFLLLSAQVTETKSLSTGPSSYITLNGRTDRWTSVFTDLRSVPLGLGVGQVGTGAARAQFGLVRGTAPLEDAAVDSGFIATTVDIGLLGLAVLLAMFGRIAALAYAVSRRAPDAGWLVLGLLAVSLTDALTRASFTGFPNAFLGLLLMGLGIAAGSSGGRFPVFAVPGSIGPRRLRVRS